MQIRRPVLGIQYACFSSFLLPLSPLAIAAWRNKQPGLSEGTVRDTSGLGRSGFRRLRRKLEGHRQTARYTNTLETQRLTGSGSFVLSIACLPVRTVLHRNPRGPAGFQRNLFKKPHIQVNALRGM